MCTVTIVPSDRPDGWRMACSRDEQHGRPPARPPEPRTCRGVQALLPIDPASGGTWIGVNEHGLALTLLNYNLPQPPTDRDRSRGVVIPALLHARSVHQVIQGLAGLEQGRMMPFRLVACDGASVMLWRSTEPVERVRVDPWDGKPVMWTSSGLGDHLVEAPRRELFESWFGDDASAYTDQQLAFHRHQWPGREPLSVCMHRDDARTVSYTTIDRAPDRITMRYHPDRPDRPDRDAHDTTLTLDPRPART